MSYSDNEVERRKLELYQSAFRSSRSSAISRMFRRFIWRYSRNFHQYHLIQAELVSQKIAEVNQKIGEIDQKIGGINQRVGGIDQKIGEFDQHLLGLMATQDYAKALALSNDAVSKDLLAMSYRFVSFEDQFARQADTGEVLGDVLRRLEELERLDERTNYAATGLFWALRPNRPTAILGTSLVLHDGPYGKFLLRQPDLISDHILGGGFWDPELKEVMNRVGANGGTAIDAGAYLGFHSVYMSRYFNAVYSFEPQVEIYRMLCTNLLLNNCHNVVAMNAALYQREGLMRLAEQDLQEIQVPTSEGEGIDYNTIGNAAALVFKPADAPGHDVVPSYTVDGLGLKDLTFMKVDTQGSDLRVLLGARETIARCRPTIVLEYERELSKCHAWTWDDLMSFLDEMNYSAETLRDQGQGKQVDILASPK